MSGRMQDWASEICVELSHAIRSDWPLGGKALRAAPGVHRGCTNPQGAVSVYVDGDRLGVKPDEIVRWWYLDEPDQPFVWVHCAWMPESIAVSEPKP